MGHGKKPRRLKSQEGSQRGGGRVRTADLRRKSGSSNAEQEEAEPSEMDGLRK